MANQEVDTGNNPLDPPNAWLEVRSSFNNPGQRREHPFHVLHLKSDNGDFQIRFPPYYYDIELEATLRTAAFSIRNILQEPSLGDDDFRGEDMLVRFKKYITRGRLLERIRAYRNNGSSGAEPLYRHEMFRWEADGWECNFNASGESRLITWTPIYNPPTDSEDSSSDSSSPDHDTPGLFRLFGAPPPQRHNAGAGSSSQAGQSRSGLFGLFRAPPPQRHNAGAGSSSQEGQSSSRKRKRKTRNYRSLSSSSDDEQPGPSGLSRAPNQWCNNVDAGTSSQEEGQSSSKKRKRESDYDGSLSSSSDHDTPGLFGLFGAPPPQRHNADAGSSSQEGHSSSRKRKRKTRNDRSLSSSSDDERPGPSGLSRASNQQQHHDVDAGSNSHQEQNSLKKRRIETGTENDASVSSLSNDDNRPGPSGLSRAQTERSQSWNQTRRDRRHQRRRTGSVPSFSTGHALARFSPEVSMCVMDPAGDSQRMGQHFVYDQLDDPGDN